MSRLFVIGTGPGDAALVAPKALDAIKASTDLVAYGLYLDLLGLILFTANSESWPVACCAPSNAADSATP